MENKSEHTVRGIRNWLKGEIAKCVTRDMRSTYRRQALEECLRQLEKLENGLGMPKEQLPE
jgi:hypothetical protein